jgi:hypothetical protein
MAAGQVLAATLALEFLKSRIHDAKIKVIASSGKAA